MLTSLPDTNQKNWQFMLYRTSHFNNPLNISLLLTGLMFLLPFVNTHYQQPIPTFYTEWIAAMLGLAAISPLAFTRSWQSIKIPQVSLLFLGLSLVLGMQWLLNMIHSTFYAFLVLSYFIWAYLLTILGATLRQELGWEKLVSVLAYALVIAGIINIGIVVLQFVMHTGGVIPFTLNWNSYGAMTQRNLFADFVSLATASLIYLYNKGRFSTSFFSLLLVFFLIMLALSGSRSSWLHLIVLTTLAIAIKVKKSKTSTLTDRLLNINLMLLPIFILVQLFIHYAVPDGLVSLASERLIDGVNADTPSARLQILYDSMRLFMNSPWLGNGFSSMRGATFLLIDHQAAMATKQVFEHAHNFFLHLLAEIGIIGFLIVSTALIAWFRTLNLREITLETWWVFALLAILAMHSMVEFPLWFTFYLGIAALLLGAIDGKQLPPKLPEIFNKRPLGGNYGRIIQICLVLALLVGTVNLGTMFIANSKLEKWVQQWANNEQPDNSQLNWVSQYSLLHSYAELMSALSININGADLEGQLLLNQSAMQFKPLQRITYNHALLLELKGDHENAIRQLNRALIAYPRDCSIILETIPSQYRQRYQDLLTEVSTIQSKSMRDYINQRISITISK